MLLKKRIMCKDDGGTMYFHDFGKMGSNHSTFYQCGKCKRIVEVFDSELEFSLEELTLKK